jgi:GAF domain-containing protein
MKTNSHEQRFSPLQIALAGVAAAFLIAILFVAVIIYRNGQLIREKSSEDSQILATIANIQRHGLLLQVETNRLLGDPSIKLDKISEQRSFISAQLRTLNGLVQNKAEILAKIHEIEASLNEFDALLSSLENSSPSGYKTAIPAFDALFAKMDREQIKQAYDLAERGFFLTLSEILKTQETAQQWLIGLWVVLLALVFTAGTWQIRTARIRYEQEKAQQKEQVKTLEQRVTDRTKALETSSEVSRRLSTILNQKELVAEVVNQVNNAFGYYHTQIYFFDQANQNLVMAGGTGQAGELMLAQFHKVAKGRGLVGRAAESNEPILVSDTTQNPEWLPNPLLPETKSEVAIPISIGDQVLGVLDVQQNTIDGLKREDVDSLQSIANQIAVALQNIKSTETVAKRAAELQTVANISTAAATIANVEEMLQQVVHLTQRGFGLYHAHVFVYNDDTAKLEIAACGYKEGDEHEGTHGATAIPLEQEHSLVARAGRTRQAVIVNDVRSDPGWLPNPILTETAAELAVPLIVGDQLLGVLDVQSERINAFTEEDANIQSTLASQIATALQNVRSFTEAQRQAERETTVNLITQKIQNTTSVEAALQIAARELGHALGMKSTLVSLDPSALAGESKAAGNE